MSRCRTSYWALGAPGSQLGGPSRHTITYTHDQHTYVHICQLSYTHTRRGGSLVGGTMDVTFTTCLGRCMSWGSVPHPPTFWSFSPHPQVDGGQSNDGGRGWGGNTAYLSSTQTLSGTRAWDSERGEVMVSFVIGDRQEREVWGNKCCSVFSHLPWWPAVCVCVWQTNQNLI